MQAKGSTQRGQGQGQAAMKMKTGNKKMRGFMCQSPAATAVCMSSGDPRSVIVPRRPDRTVQLDHSKKFMNNAKYSRLVESRRFLPVHNKRSLIISPLPIKRDPDPAAAHQKPSPLHNSSLLTTPSDQVFQVVVMRVSLHCQGCAGKVKKHLLKMEGVTSFSIDLETKRVTVMGHVSPAGVVESISKVKKAELWPCN